MIFATKDTFTREDVYQKYAKDHFDAIIIDEVHRLGEQTTYQRILEYFKPKKLWLGMTASPERTDGYDIYKEFDHNIACEIRLKQALEEDLLCPFHYFGITEFIGKDNEEYDLNDFRLLVSKERIDYIIDKIKFYGFSGDRVKGLMFCSRVDEAEKLSEAFNKKGYATAVLTGNNNDESVRSELIDRLVSDNREDKLDYIITVNVFNEGVDIPEINQIVMLRPTESPIIFVQQLGRGLRKAKDKEYVVVLDFIGNYNNNFMIPIALSGDRSYNKDNVRKFIQQDSKKIPGCSTINFDEISKRKIYNAIDVANFSDLRLIKQNYINLKNKIGRIPTLNDFNTYGEIDPILIIKRFKSYYNLLVYVEGKEIKNKFNDNKKGILEYLSTLLVKGVRPHELELLKCIIEEEQINYTDLKESLTFKYGISISHNTFYTIINNINGKFVRLSHELEKNKNIRIVEIDDNNVKITSQFKSELQDRDFFAHLIDLIAVSFYNYNQHYKTIKKEKEKFALYKKYTRRDVCLLMDVGKDCSSTMYGMKKFFNEVFLFVTYHKVKKGDDNLEYFEGKPDYADEFIDKEYFKWDSRIGKGVESSYTKDILQAAEKHLFIKKSDDDDSFYYIGKFTIHDYRRGKKKDNKGREQEITKFVLRLDEMIGEELLGYFQSYIPNKGV